MSIEVMNCVWKHAPVQSGEFAVLLALADYADENGSCFPSIPTLARKSRLKERQTQNCLRSLADTGFVRVEAGAGPKGCNRYIVVTAEIEARSICRQTAETDALTAGGANIAPPQSATEGVQSSASGGAMECTQTTIEPPIEPSPERERAGEGREGEPTEERTEQPGTAAFEKRVMRFCNGRGFVAGAWPDWDTSSPGWIAGQFAKLSPEERAEAERWRDPYLLDIADRKKSPMPVGVFLKGKTWTGLDLSILQRAAKARDAALKPEERAKPDGWAAMLGPVGMAWLLGALLKGPEPDAPEIGPVFLDAQLQRAWPAVWQFNRIQQTRGGLEIAPRWHALKQMMEGVPAGSLVLGAWKWAFARHGWPWLQSFDNADAVWLPKVEQPAADAIGPPDMAAAIERTMGAFEAAVKAGDEETGNDGGRSQAA